VQDRGAALDLGTAAPARNNVFLKIIGCLQFPTKRNMCLVPDSIDLSMKCAVRWPVDSGAVGNSETATTPNMEWMMPRRQGSVPIGRHPIDAARIEDMACSGEVSWPF
jgi:hypothetical protein